MGGNISGVDVKLAELSRRAKNCWALGQFDEAKSVWEQALAVVNEAGNSAAVQRARVLSNLALANFALADFAEAKTLWEQALELEKNHYGEYHVEVAMTRNNLAMACAQLGQLEDASRMTALALQCYANHPDYGPEHANALNVVHMSRWINQLGLEAMFGTNAIHQPPTTQPLGGLNIPVGQAPPRVLPGLPTRTTLFGNLSNASQPPQAWPRTSSVTPARRRAIPWRGGGNANQFFAATAALAVGGVAAMVLQKPGPS